MEFGKIKFFFKTMLVGIPGSTLLASSTDTTGLFDVDFIADWLESFVWKAEDDTDPATITFDAGAGNTPSADYLTISRHNLGTLGASAALQNSTDNFASDVETVSAVLPSADTILFDEARLIANAGKEVWQAGVSTVLTGWGLVGAGASVARESTIIKTGLYSAALTRAGTNTNLFFEAQNFLFFANKTVTYGEWVYATVANTTRITLSDDVGASTASAFHSGTPGFEFLTVTRVIDAAPTRLRISCTVINSDTTSYFDNSIVKVASTVVSTDKSDFIQPESNGKRYWRLNLADDDSAAFTAAPSLGIAVWGDKVELDHASMSFDPNAEEPDVNINRGHGGIVSGVHTKSTDRAFTLGFTNKNAAFYDKVNDWWQTHGQQQIFVGWNTEDHPDQVYLMFPDGDFRNPIRPDGDNEKRDVIIDLRGVKE